MLIQTALFCSIMLCRLLSGYRPSGVLAASIFRIGDSLIWWLKQQAFVYQTPRCHVQQTLSTKLTAFTSDVSCQPAQTMCSCKLRQTKPWMWLLIYENALKWPWTILAFSLPVYFKKECVVCSLHVFRSRVASLGKCNLQTVLCLVYRWRLVLSYYIFIYLLQLGCYPVAVVILHVYKTWNCLLLHLSLEGYMRSM